MKVCVIVLNYKGKKDTLECLESLAKANYNNFQVAVVDNHSQDDSVSYLKEKFPSLIYLETGENLGYAGGNNFGIRYALTHNFDAILILNNDTILEPDCISGFVTTSKTHPSAILGGKVYQYYERTKLQHLGGIWHHKKGKFIQHPENLNQIDKRWDDVYPLDFIVGCALFIPSKVFHQIGLFEESFFLHYEEIDFCIRAKKAGFPSLYTPKAVLYHKESASFANPRPPQMYFQTRNRLLFLKRNFSTTEYYKWLLTKFSYRLALLFFKLAFKNGEIFLLSLTNPKKITPQKLSSKLAIYASIRGAFDYFRGKFGNGPLWIYTYIK